jgi:hypothetical protein
MSPRFGDNRGTITLRLVTAVGLESSPWTGVKKIDR